MHSGLSWYLRWVSSSPAAQQASGIVYLTYTACATVEAAATEPRILHFVNCGLEQWIEKYEVLGAFPDRWMGGNPIGLEFHIASRNVINGDGVANRAAAMALYSQVMVWNDPNEVQEFMQAGVLERFLEVTKFVRSLCSKSSDKKQAVEGSDTRMTPLMRRALRQGAA